MPVIRFEDQQLTSFGGVIVFLALFQHLDLKARLKQCFQHVKGSPILGPHRIVLVLIVHLLLGFRRSRDVDYYRDDPLVQRLLGLRRLPDVATISRTLATVDRKSVGQVRQLSSALVIEGIQREQFARLTLDSMARLCPRRDMPRAPPSDTTPRRRARAVTTTCLPPWLRRDNFSTSFTAPAMSMTARGPMTS